MNGKNDVEVLLGDPKKAILAMFFPFLLAAAVVQINHFVDTFWVSGLGATPSSAVSTIFPVYGLIVCVGLGIGVGATTTIAFRLGMGHLEEARKLAGQSLILGILCSIASSLILFILLNPIIDLMGAQSIRSECIAYALPFLVLSPLIILESVIGATLRAEGAAKRSTIVQVSAALLNMAIDPILIYGLNMGLTGAGLATCISAGIALAIGFNWYVRGKTVLMFGLSDLKPSRLHMAEVMEVGGPRTGQSIIMNVGDILQRVFLIFCGGTNAVMYYNYAWKYIGLGLLPSGALETSMIPVCSASNGQNNALKMRDGIQYALKMSLLSGLAIMAFMFIFADPLISIMTYESSMNALKGSFTWTLRMSALVLPCMAIMGIGNSVLQALKKSRVSMVYYFLWTFLKLALYAVACLFSYEAIIYCMVGLHAFAGLCLIILADREFSKRFPGVKMLSWRH